MNDSPFKAIQDAQETAREGWMPEIKVSMWEQRYNEMIATCAFTAKERDDALAEIDRLKKGLGEAKADANALYNELSQLTEHICECDEKKLLACDDDPHPPSVFHVYSKSAMTALAQHEKLTSQRQ